MLLRCQNAGRESAVGSTTAQKHASPSQLISLKLYRMMLQRSGHATHRSTSRNLCQRRGWAWSFSRRKKETIRKLFQWDGGEKCFTWAVAKGNKTPMKTALCGFSFVVLAFVRPTYFNRPWNHHLGVLAAADLVHILWSRNGFDKIVQDPNHAGCRLSNFSLIKAQERSRKCAGMRWTECSMTCGR